MLTFIGYAWFRMLCATAVRLRTRTVVCVPFFRIFPRTWSCLLSIVGHYCRVLVHVHPASHAYLKGNFLSAERGSDPWYDESTPLLRAPLVRTAYSVSKRHFFSAACLFDASTCSCGTRYDISASQQMNYLLPPPFLFCYVNTCSAAVLLYVPWRHVV